MYVSCRVAGLSLRDEGEEVRHLRGAQCRAAAPASQAIEESR